MLVMLDNYDSFTYNLVQYLGELGQMPEVYRNDQITVEELIGMKPDGIVLSPGPGRPEQGGIMLDVIRHTAGSIPILGVCLGHQALAQAYGGCIGYAPTLMHGKVSQIEHDGSPLYAAMPNPFSATRYHSLVVERESLPEAFSVTAWTGDVIMGIAHKELPLYGVQFHPESILTEHGKTLLSNFLKLLS